MEGDFGEVKVRVVLSNQNLFAVTAKQLRTIPALSRNQYPLEKWASTPLRLNVDS
jgi:hypothetical protein